MINKEKIKHLVVDSSAFLRQAILQELGECVYTLPEVTEEIRDAATRQHLQVLPYELTFKQPSAESVKFVNEFAKKTGDYASLSAVDIRLIALTYELECCHVGKAHIKNEPDKNLVSWTALRQPIERSTDIAGFHLDGSAKNKVCSRTVSVSSPVESLDDQLKSLTLIQNEEGISPNSTGIDSKSSSVDCSSECEKKEINRNNNAENKERIEECARLSQLDGAKVRGDDSETRVLTSCNNTVDKSGMSVGEKVAAEIVEHLSEESDDSEESDNDEDDDGGWITPDNIGKVRDEVLSRQGHDKVSPATVACITTDFAMQNVLIQMGLNVISVDGYMITKAKSYVLRCFACFRITTDVGKQFCYHCGNNTLQKVTKSVSSDGSVQYHLSKKKPVSRRGLRHSLPMPRGGKHAINPILCPDQRQPHQRITKKSHIKYDVFDPDYLAMASPFAPIDVHSRASQLGIRQTSDAFKKKRNPNEKKKLYGRRK